MEVFKLRASELSLLKRLELIKLEWSLHHAKLSSGFESRMALLQVRMDPGSNQLWVREETYGVLDLLGEGEDKVRFAMTLVC